MLASFSMDQICVYFGHYIVIGRLYLPPSEKLLYDVQAASTSGDSNSPISVSAHSSSNLVAVEDIDFNPDGSLCLGEK